LNYIVRREVGFSLCDELPAFQHARPPTPIGSTLRTRHPLAFFLFTVITHDTYPYTTPLHDTLTHDTPTYNDTL
jgi:hypothetical protein